MWEAMLGQCWATVALCLGWLGHLERLDRCARRALERPPHTLVMGQVHVSAATA